MGIFKYLSNIQSAVELTIFLLVVACILIIVKITNTPIIVLTKQALTWILNKVAKVLHKREKKYHRDLEIGKIDEKRNTVKLYRFLNDLIIDLQLKESGITPYELLLFVGIGSFIGTLFVCELIFNSFAMAIIATPIVAVAVLCIMYTRANLAHDARIEAVIEAENIICNNIKSGVVTAIRENINTLPKQVRPDFKDFIDNIEYKNYHVKTALQELNAVLGNVADDFIKKCIMFELEEERGIVGMFADVVEVNNIRLQQRIKMKREFEKVLNDFKIGATMIFVFLFGVLAIYPNVREWYFTTFLGHLILIIDLLLLIIEYVYITYLRAQEL